MCSLGKCASTYHTIHGSDVQYFTPIMMVRARLGLKFECLKFRILELKKKTQTSQLDYRDWL